MQTLSAFRGKREWAGGRHAPAVSAGERRLATPWAVAMPLLALSLYVVVVCFRGGALSAATFAYSDAPEGAYLGAALFHAPARLPLHTELVTTLMAGGLLHVPAAHALIQLLGPALMLAAVAAACVGIHRLGGAWWLTGAAGVALGPIPLWTALYPTAHVYTLLCLAVAAVAAIALGRGRLGLPQAALVGVLCGSAVVSDQSFIVEGVIPLAAAVAGMTGLRRSPAALRAVALMFVTAVATTAAGAALLLLADVHIVFALAPGAVGTNTFGLSVYSVLHTFSAMVSGAWFGSDPAPPLGVLTTLAGIAIPLAAPLTLLVAQRRSPGDAGRLAYLRVWAAADVLVVASFLGFRYGGPPLLGRYLIPCLFSAIATFPLLVTSGRLRIVSVVSAVTAAAVVVQAIGVLTISPATFGSGSAAENARILEVIRAQGLTRGYAGYWPSHPITWLSGETVHVYPVQQRQCDGGLRVCPYEYSSDAWYRPSPGPTFLLIDRADRCVTTAPATLGAPVRTVRIDADATLLIFDHDIARAFAATPVASC